MMNEQLYEAMEAELAKNRVREEIEDILLDLAEEMADLGVLDKEIVKKVSYGKTVVEACGICSEEDGEVSVLIRWLRIGKKEFQIDDYLL